MSPSTQQRIAEYLKLAGLESLGGREAEVERADVRGGALAIELCQGADGPRRLPEALQIRRREQQTQVARLNAAQIDDLREVCLCSGRFVE